MSEDISKKITDIHINEAQRSIDSVFDSLVLNTSKAILPESIFRQVFLPYFSGDLSIQGTNIIAEWVSIAGTISSSVDIVEDGNHSNVLYTVPSIVDTSVINVVNPSRTESFDTIYKQFTARNDILPSMGDNYLQQQLSSKLGIINTESDSKKHISEKWLTIFNRYGLHVQTKPNTISDEESDVEY